jgi:hypothetical protein
MVDDVSPAGQPLSLSRWGRLQIQRDEICALDPQPLSG